MEPMQPSSRGGRPRLDDDKKRQPISVSLLPESLSDLRIIADDFDLSLSGAVELAIEAFAQSKGQNGTRSAAIDSQSYVQVAGDTTARIISEWIKTGDHSGSELAETSSMTFEKIMRSIQQSANKPFVPPASVRAPRKVLSYEDFAEFANRQSLIVRRTGRVMERIRSLGFEYDPATGYLDVLVHSRNQQGELQTTKRRIHTSEVVRIQG